MRTSIDDPNRGKKNEAMRTVFYNSDVKTMTMKKDSSSPSPMAKRPPSQPESAKLTQDALAKANLGIRPSSSPTPTEVSVDVMMTRYVHLQQLVTCKWSRVVASSDWHLHFKLFARHTPMCCGCICFSVPAALSISYLIIWTMNLSP